VKRVVVAIAAVAACTIILRAAGQLSVDDASVQYQLATQLADENRYLEAIDAFELATHTDNAALVRLLLDRGASIEAATRVGVRPAARPPGTGGGSHGVGIVRSGVPSQGEQLPAPGGMTPLLFAARDGLLDAAKILLEAGADANRPDPNGITPLAFHDSTDDNDFNVISDFDGDGEFDEGQFTNFMAIVQGPDPLGRQVLYVAAKRGNGNALDRHCSVFESEPIAIVQTSQE